MRRIFRTRNQNSQQHEASRGLSAIAELLVTCSHSTCKCLLVY